MLSSKGVQMKQRYSIHSIIMVVIGLMLIGFASSCSGDDGGNLIQNPVMASEPGVEATPRVASEVVDEMDIHAQHSGQSCGICHTIHGNLYPTRDNCLVCHELPGIHRIHRPRPNHVRCISCHSGIPRRDYPPVRADCVACHTEYSGYVTRYECTDCHWPV